MEGVVVSEISVTENMDTRSHTPCTNDADNDDVDDDISVGSHSPLPPTQHDTDDESMIDVDDSCTEDSTTRDKEAASPKQEPPDPAMSPGGPPSPRATPPVAHQPNNNQLLQRALKFSIDNILKPDFGIRRLSETSDSLEQPVDLSRVTHRDTLKAFGLPTKTLRGLQTTQPQQNNGMKDKDAFGNSVWPAWVYCTRYSDRPSAGPRTRRIKKRDKKDEKRPRTAFTSEQLARLKKEFQENRYLTEKRRQDLARDLGLNESQIKIWFQNKRAKIKKNTSTTSSNKNPLALQLMAQGLYNHATIPIREEDEEKLLLPPA